MVMTPEQLKRMVFPGESGGDYNALFGYSNRPGRQFSGVKVTDMTVDQALQFAAPSGPYGQTVKSQIGRVATPMGAYQVVGRTLAAAKAGLGLTGNERMTPELQDQIGMWIYQNQGPGAWEAWGGGGSGSRSGNGGGAMPMGLFDMQEEPQTFGQRLKRDWQSGELMDNIALAANSLLMRPDPNFAQMIQGRQEQRAGRETANRTAQWLMSQGREDLAQALMTGAIDPKTAVAAAMTPPADNRTAMIQNYEYWLSQGKTPEEAQALARAGAGGTTIDMSGGGKFEEGFAKSDADLLGTVFATGLQATRNLGRIEQLDQLLRTSPGGAEAALMQFANELGISTEGGNAITAAQAIINSLVPEQRAPGSGPMSDADLALFKQSLPRIINQPGGNAIILGTMKAIAQYDAEGAAIVQRLRSGEISRSDAFQLLMDRQNPLAQFRGSPATDTGSGTGGGVTLSPGAESLIEP
jgi:hypothetical protein